MNQNDMERNTLAALASELDTMEGVHATVHITPTTWVGVIIEAYVLGTAVLRRIAEYNCGIVETSRPASGQIVAIIETAP